MRFVALAISLICGLVTVLVSPASAKPTDLPVVPAVAVARTEYAMSIAAANKALSASKKSIQAAFDDAIRLAGTKEAMVAAQARALAWHATASAEVRDRYAPLLAAAASKRERQSISAALNRELKEIEQTTESALRVARRLVEPKYARAQAERVKAQSLSVAKGTFNESKRAALARLNAVLLAHGLPASAG